MKSRNLMPRIPSFLIIFLHLSHLSSHLVQCCTTKAAANCWQNDLPNGKIGLKTISECCAACTNHTECTAFTLDKTKGGSSNTSLGNCYLKYNCELLAPSSSPTTIAGVLSSKDFPSIYPPTWWMKPYTVSKNIATQFGAKCLNGAAPQYLVRRNSSSNKWVLFLEGGGWCYGSTSAATIASCAGRGGFNPPAVSAMDYGFTMDYGGILGSNATTNPDFYTWNAVFIHYCDGASFGSNRVQPIVVQNKTTGEAAHMWMRGRSNFDAVIHDLLLNNNMSKATEVILSGGSAGGLAVYYNLDHLAKDLLPSTVQRVTGFPDAGFFMDADNYVKDFQGADPVWNITGSSGTNKNCLKAYSDNEKWKCLLAPFILEHIETPIYIMNSAYDAWQLGNNKVGCFNVENTTCKNDSAVLMYGQALKNRVKNGLRNKTIRFPTATKSGAYIDSCYVHEQNVNYCSAQSMPNCVGWSPLESGSIKWDYTTAIESLTPQEAFSKYYFSQGLSSQSVLIDSEEVQKNPTCIYKGVPK